MAASILTLLAGVVESFIGKKPSSEIAKNLGVEFPELRVALQQTIHHTWRGKLIFVLGDPEFRTDLIPFYTHLARLEEQYGVLMNQRRRAELICTDYRAQPHPVALQLILKAEMFANRVQSQCVRVLASIQKTELLLAKAEKSAPEQEQAQEASQSTPRAEVKVAPLPETPSPAAANEAPTEATTQPPTVGSAMRTEESTTPAPQATNHPSPATPESFPTPEQFKQLIFKHRHRIKDTRAEDRPALIARLIEQDRKQNQNQPDPQRNGKQAA